MSYGVVVMLLIVAVSGLIAYIGDNVGRKVGKKRVSIFNLRPKYTSIIITIITGMMIASVTLGAMLLMSKTVRKAFFGLKQLETELKTKGAELDKLTNRYVEQKMALDKSNELLKIKQEELDAIISEIKKNSTALETMQKALTENKNKVVNLNKERLVLENKKSSLEKEIFDSTRLSAAVLGKANKDVLFGDILYTKGEPLARIRVPKKINSVELEAALTKNLNIIFRQAMEKGAVVEEDARPFFLAQFQNLLKALKESDKDLLLEVRSHTNVLSGQPIYLTLTIVDDNVIYKKGEVVERDIIKAGLTQPEVSRILAQMLTRASASAKTAGMLPDPETGRVGYIPAKLFVQAVNKLTKQGKSRTVELYTVEDIYLSGRLNVDIRPVK